MKLYNSTKIIKAIQGNQTKFEILRKLAKEILKVRESKKLQEEYVKKSYNIVLKNLSSTKKEVTIVDQEKKNYSVNKTGISNKNSYGTNSNSIANSGNLFMYLVEVKKALPCFLKVLSPSKKVTLRKFLEKAMLLEEKAPTQIDMGIDIEWVDDNNESKKQIKHLSVTYNYSGLNIGFGGGGWNDDRINVIDLEFEDYALIEQLYNSIKNVLESELKQNVKELENMKKFLTDIDQKFSNYIKSVETLNELRKGD